jgi:hypothetical protein
LAMRGYQLGRALLEWNKVLSFQEKVFHRVFHSMRFRPR